MTTCERYREALLEAELDDLRGGEGETDLARHIRDCPACARAAEIILETTASLHAFLGHQEHAPDLDALILRATTAEGGEPRPADRTGPVVRQHRRRTWVPLAAAAAIAALLLLPGRPAPLPPLATIPSSFPLPTVESAPGQTVAVLETDNPDITVLWFF